jgi:GNAT superfamily N-acetyltransferase
VQTNLRGIQSFRGLFLQEFNAQVRYNACHERGWTDSYLLLKDDREIGYGSIKGNEPSERDTIFEFYVIPPFRRSARALFRALLTASKATRVECQSNDALMSGMLFEFAHSIKADVVLFKDGPTTELRLSGAVFRQRRSGDRIFEHTVEPVGDYVLELDRQIAATGGFLLHYNPPFADVYMEVETNYRRKGFGSYLVQEIIRECFLAGRVPAARCDLRNVGSRAALLKAGMQVAGFMLTGHISQEPGPEEPLVRRSK